MSKKRSINIEVILKHPKEPIERMIKRFTKKVKKSKIIENYKERQFYEKPSEKRKKEKRQKIRTLEKLRKERENTTKRY